jgi:hypothetical protein
MVAGAFTVVLVAGVVTVVDVAGATTAALFCVVVWLVVVVESLSARAIPKGAITAHSAMIWMVWRFHANANCIAHANPSRRALSRSRQGLLGFCDLCVAPTHMGTKR